MATAQFIASDRWNLVVLRGVIHREVEHRSLPSGTEVASFDLDTGGAAGAHELVPVAWHEPSGDLAVGLDVVVTGRVRRRFFRTAGGTQSRTEVVADTVVAARQHRRVVGAIGKALAPVTGA